MADVAKTDDDSDLKSKRGTQMANYHCHNCGKSFLVEIKNEYGTYEFKRCPNCGSGKTTLA